MFRWKSPDPLVRTHRFLRLLLAVACAVGGCAAPPKQPGEPDQLASLALMGPARIDIVEPFTEIRSFDDDAQPDGIELRLRAVNKLGEPGQMLVGRVRVELYEFIKASGDHKGRQLQLWNVDLSSDDHQRRFWNKLTQMNDLRLQIDASQLERARHFVLLVTYESPWGERLTDETVIDLASTDLPRRLPLDRG